MSSFSVRLSVQLSVLKSETGVIGDQHPHVSATAPSNVPAMASFGVVKEGHLARKEYSRQSRLVSRPGMFSEQGIRFPSPRVQFVPRGYGIRGCAGGQQGNAGPEDPAIGLRFWRINFHFLDRSDRRLNRRRIDHGLLRGRRQGQQSQDGKGSQEFHRGHLYV